MLILRVRVVFCVAFAFALVAGGARDLSEEARSG